jgi:hypothetical protein
MPDNSGDERQVDRLIPFRVRNIDERVPRFRLGRGYRGITHFFEREALTTPEDLRPPFREEAFLRRLANDSARCAAIMRSSSATRFAGIR